MRAAYIESYGGPEKIIVSDLPTPIIQKPNQILVEVYASSLNPLDYVANKGFFQIFTEVKFPHTFGCDVAGVVKEVGTGVKKFKVGDEVFTCLDFRENGASTEYIVVSESIVSLKPTNLSFNEAAAIPLAGLTALQGISRSAIREKEYKKIFISGGLGGVGHIAIQLAKNYFGAEVIATTVSEKKIPFAKELGATHVIDYKKENYLEKLKDYDFALDTTGEAAQQLKIIRKGGAIYSISTLPDGNETFNFIPVSWFIRRLLDLFSLRWSLPAKLKNVDYKYIFAAISTQDLDILCRLCEEGKLKPIIDKIYTLDEIKQAVEYGMEAHTIGKIIIEIKKP